MAALLQILRYLEAQKLFSISSKWLKGPKGHCGTMRFGPASGAGKDQPCPGPLLAGFWAIRKVFTLKGGIIREYSRIPKNVEGFPGS